MVRLLTPFRGGEIIAAVNSNAAQQSKTIVLKPTLCPFLSVSTSTVSPTGAEEMVPLWYWLKVIFVLVKTLQITLK